MSWKRTLGVMFTAQLLSAVGFSTIFPFLPNYVERLGAAGGSTLFWVTAVFSAQALTMMIASPIWGAVADRHGRKLMVERAMFGGAAVILAMAFVQTAAQLVVLRAVQGMVTGVVSAAVSLVAATTPRKHMGYAMGLMQTAQWAGVSVGPVIGGVLEYLVGDRMAFVVTAVLLLIGGALVVWGVHEDFTPAPGGRGLRGMVGRWGEVLRSRGVGLAYGVRFSAWLGRNLIVPFLPLFVAGILVDRSLAGIHTGIAIGLASASGTVSAIVLGRWGDRIGHKPILVGAAVVVAAAYAPMAAVQHIWQLDLLNVLVGAAVGGVLPAISALLAGYTEQGHEGSVYGLDNAVVAGARAVAPLLGGAVVAFWGVPEAPAYRAVFVAAAAFFLVTAALAAWGLPGEAGGARPSGGGVRTGRAR